MFVPGDKPRFLEKAAGSNADAVFLDLEDGVLPEQKPGARKLVAETLARPEFRPLRFVRVNAVETPWHTDDLDAVLVPGLDGICLPKTQRPEHVHGLAARLDEFEAAQGLPNGSVRIVAAIETAFAIIQAPAVAASSTRLAGLIFGAEDFALDLGLSTNRQGEAAELIYARSAIVVAAAASHILSIDGVYPDLDDPAGLAADILQSRRLGFSSKSTFNPRQLDDINTAFSPTPEEIAYATTVVDAFEEARARGDASVAVGGQLVDLPIVQRAQRILELVGQGDATGGAN